MIIRGDGWTYHVDSMGMKNTGSAMILAYGRMWEKSQRSVLILSMVGMVDECECSRCTVARLSLVQHHKRT